MIADPGHIRAQHEAAYDALADMFLGELAPVSARDAAVGVKPSQPRQSQPFHGTGHVPGGPAQPVPPLHLVSSETPDEDDTAEAIQSVRPGVFIDALVLGHLPVMAGAWAGQYVRHVAASSIGPVAHVRLSCGHVRIEYFEGALAPPRALGCPSTFVAAGTLADAVAILQQRHARVVMHVDGEQELALAQACAASFATSAGSLRVSMLTSADEAGVVGAYRTIKAVASRVEAAQALHDSTTINIVIMGAPEPRAKYVWRRLQEAAETFLGVELALAARIERIGPGVSGGVVFDGDCPHGAPELVSMLTTGPSCLPKVPVLSPAIHLADAPSLVSGRHEGADETRRPRAAPVSVNSTIAPAADVPAVAAPLLAQTALPTLASCLPGLTGMKARCPHAEDVELAFDESGALHLLARWRADEPDHRVVERLHAAGCWARLHCRVLSLTLPDSTPLDASSPARHLFTDRPAEHRALFDSDLRLHLLVEVSTLRTEPWVCAAIN